eukprot:5331995-Amphidinium_carterae.1
MSKQSALATRGNHYVLLGQLLILMLHQDEDKVVVEHALDALRKIPYQAAPYWDYIKPHTKHSNAFVRG